MLSLLESFYGNPIQIARVWSLLESSSLHQILLDSSSTHITLEKVSELPLLRAPSTIMASRVNDIRQRFDGKTH